MERRYITALKGFIILAPGGRKWQLAYPNCREVDWLLADCHGIVFNRSDGVRERDSILRSGRWKKKSNPQFYKILFRFGGFFFGRKKNAFSTRSVKKRNHSSRKERKKGGRFLSLFSSKNVVSSTIHLETVRPKTFPPKTVHPKTVYLKYINL
jgi:hypothetical protein